MRKNCTVCNSDRKRIIDSYENGSNASEISRIMGIKRTTVHEIIKKYINSGIVNAEIRGGTRPHILNDDQKEEIKRWINDNCTLSLKKIANKVQEQFGIMVSISTVRRIIGKFHYSLKRISLVPQRRNDPSTIATRRQYALDFVSLPSQYTEEQLIFIDEVGFNVSMRSNYGRSEVGKPAHLVVANIRSRNISICCSMNKNNIIHYVTKTSAYNTASFKEYIIELIAILQEKNILTGMFIMDNVSFHKSNEIKEVINNSNYKYMYLPPYSPFLNPIENMFSKWKDIVARSNPTNEDALFANIESASLLISQADCNGYFRNMYNYIPRSLNEGNIDN